MVVVAVGGAPVLSSGGAGGALSRGDPHQGVQQYPEPARTGQRSAKPATVRNGPKTPYIYRYIQGL